VSKLDLTEKTHLLFPFTFALSLFKGAEIQQLEQELDLESLDETAEEELVVIGCAGAHAKDGEGRTEAGERENWIKAITFIE